ncbi:MAG: ABC transporter permease [Nitrospinae bacterium]|nr:ABC transporter permease [Nitrospinota bacterium]MBF0635533.1 ABC transporter permease [Nitrospinota bacterium]
MIRHLTENAASLYRRRELISTLVSKELKARYRGSILGIVWTFLNPLLLLLVYSLVFSVYMRVQMENYALFVFTGLLPWIWFASSLGDGAASVVGSGSLITKSMFPAEVLPMVKILSNLMNYIFSLPLILIFMLAYGVPLRPSILWLPVVMAVQLVLTLGLVYFLSALNVRFRDTQHVLGNLLTLWFFLTPVLYSVNNAPADYRHLLYLNPITTLAVSYQDIFLYGKAPDLTALLALAAFGAVVSLIGFRQFEIGKDMFAEEI